jgi:hypothetical protein
MTQSTKNIVLVHGGFVDGSGWESVYSRDSPTLPFYSAFRAFFDFPQYLDNFSRHTIYTACTIRIIL